MFRYAQHITVLVTIMTYITFLIYSNTHMQHLTIHIHYVGQLNTFPYAVLNPYTLQTLH